MMEPRRPAIGWPWVAVSAAVAAALGFGAARWIAPASPAGASAPTAAPAPRGGDADIPLAINIPAEYLAAAKIEVEAVARGSLRAQILAAGTVTAPPNSEAVIVARAAGNISRINRQLGDKVRANETLALVSSEEAASMAAARRVADTREELARKGLARESALFEQGVTPRQDMEAARAALDAAQAEAQRARSVAQAAHVSADGKSVAVVSPIAGTITVQTATLGGYAQPQTELFRVSGAGPVQVEAAVPASDIARVAIGDQATITAANGEAVAATVRSITPTVNGGAHAATVVLSPAAGAPGLIVGAGVRARLHVRDDTGGLVVPEDAVQNIDGRDVLFVRTGDGFQARAVLVGQRGGGMAQITSGVRAGERIATRNAFLVKADMIKSAKDE
ncbi:cobalt-zinc-cadmium efflux system membrane fusion protein [Duganella sp. 1411]|jgi:cobalt-zinc-cadmium efflux system membrane fusion protein|uniref:efflux RND transporter periplasmic adaptor subunit n=1 Tax=Duganella sp. 1411 TaxID=2806572 RepID=UPI001AE23C68|nr:efflux RND transporter periplasmic adaptor subunit [Duganella sp. 1411]MBP1203483.1 cobalt-zinc-cadmium efflux system membrane fusion protein [Duganella sp. 1411]